MALVTIPEIQVLDPYYDKVVLLLSGNGANGSTTFSDNSLTRKTITTFGNAQISTAQSVFGGASMYFDGAGDYATSGTNLTDCNFGSSNFTLECRVYLPSLPSAYKRIFGCTPATFPNEAGESVVLEISSTNRMTAYIFSGTTPYGITVSSVIATSVFTHWAIVRNGSTLTLFRNGVAVGSVAVGSVAANWSSSMQVFIGRWATSSARDFNGYIDDLRVTKGVARYTANFTPPADEFPWLDASLLGARAFNTNVARRICAPARALAPGGPVTAAMNANLYRRNIYQGGLGQITGTVKEKSLPANVPLHRRVCLLEEKTRLLVAETWSDATTGNYTFDRIDPTRTYTVMSYDHTGLYRAVIADAQVPEAMP